MSLSTDLQSRHEAGQEDKVLRRGSWKCVDLDWLVERDETRPRKDGIAIMYPGTLRPEGRKVAIRTFPRVAEKGNGEERVLREVTLWCQLRHKNILPLLGITTAFGQDISIVSPWMDRDAHQYVQDYTIDPRPLLLGIAKGLLYLHHHEPPVYHGDVKGWHNVLISDEGQPLLTGFCLSRLANSESDSNAVEGRSGGGTPQWMSPEYLDSRSPTSEADVWAFGMTALELFTRRNPFPDTRTPRLASGRIFGTQLPRRPTEDCTYSRLTDKWWQICSLCWEVEASKRPSMLRIVEKIVDAESCQVFSPVRRI